MKRSFTILALLLGIMSACDKEQTGETAGLDGPGQGGSLARFTIANNHLFAVNDQQLRVFSLRDKTDPVQISEINLGVTVETIFPRDSATLFLGSKNGMFIFDISEAPKVTQLSFYEHLVSCDPVVANQHHAYVTLHSDEGNFSCNRNTNELQILDISDLSNPRLISSYPLIKPMGLGLLGDTLLICDRGVKIFDVSDPLDPEFITATEKVEAVDLIPLGDLIIIRTENGISQYRYHNASLQFLSEL